MRNKSNFVKTKQQLKVESKLKKSSQLRINRRKIPNLEKTEKQLDKSNFAPHASLCENVLSYLDSPLVHLEW